MSARDRNVLKEAGLSQTKVAQLFDMTPQGVSRGINDDDDYLTHDRLSKLIRLVQAENPRAARILEGHLRETGPYERIKEGDTNKASGDIKPVTFSELLKRQYEHVIWIPTDPIGRIAEEAAVLKHLLYGETAMKRIVILTSEGPKDIEALINERLWREFKTWIKVELLLVHSQRLGPTPEMLLTETSAFVKSAAGFHELKDTETRAVMNRLMRETKIAPDYLPIEFVDKYKVDFSKFTSPYKRGMFCTAQIRKADLSEEQLKWLKDFNDFPEQSADEDPLRYILSTLSAKLPKIFDDATISKLKDALELLILRY